MTAAAKLGEPVRHLGTVGSTMTEAARWAAAGAPHGAVVVAEHQDAGRGRHGRAWTAAPGESLLFTIVLRPALPSGRLGLIPLAAGLAVAEALDAFGVKARIKWPNDVRVDGKKLAGVLAEASLAPGGPLVLLGVGLNVRQRDFPDGLADAATSLRLESGDDFAPLAALAPILARLDAALDRAATAPDSLVAAVEARMERFGAEIDVRDPSRERLIVRGRVLGLASDGALRLATDAGETTVHAGEVTLAAP